MQIKVELNAAPIVPIIFINVYIEIRRQPYLKAFVIPFYFRPIHALLDAMLNLGAKN